VINKKRVHRLWKDEGLQVPQKRRKKRLVGIGANVGAMSPIVPDALWAMDFQFDHTIDGRQIKVTRDCSSPRKTLVDHKATLLGNPNYWYYNSYGAHNGDSHITYGNRGGARDNWALWVFPAGDGGRYRIQCWVPYNSTATVRYDTIRNNKLVRANWINQTNHYGWTNITDINVGTTGLRLRLQDNLATKGLPFGVDVCRGLPIG